MSQRWNVSASTMGVSETEGLSFLVLPSSEEHAPSSDASHGGAFVFFRVCGVLLDRLLTTRYSLGVIFVELAYQMKLRRMWLRWLPCLQNQETDDQTNDEFRHFDPKKRIPVRLEGL